MKECYIYKKLSGDKAGGNVQCRACNHFCVIENNKQGLCSVRKNMGGKLYSLTYAKPCAINIDPIEKKPLYHFLPQTKTLSVATVGCNFKCLACQNYEISQVERGSDPLQNWPGSDPLQIVEMAEKNYCPSISYTYTEPTVFLEYAYDIMKLAKQAGLKNIWVSNGFFSPETFETILPYLDAANIDLKSFDEEFYQKICGGHLQPILENLKRLKENKIHLEITTLVIPTLNDSPTIFEKIADFIANELSRDTPWHISRFSPEISWRLGHLPATPLSTLQTAQQIAHSRGLQNVHLGNV